MALKPDAWDRSLKPDAGDRSLYRSERQTQGDRRTPPDQARSVCLEHLAVPVRPQLAMCGSLTTPVRVVCTACAGLPVRVWLAAPVRVCQIRSADNINLQRNR